MTLKPLSIIKTILDTDAYKLHMQQAVFHHYPTATVVAEFRCRNHDTLGHYAGEILEQIELMRGISLTDDEYRYLTELPFFHTDYLDWLTTYRYNPDQVDVKNIDGQLYIRITGLWLDVILWEVPLLALISELVHHRRAPTLGVNQAIERLETKLIDFRHATQDTDLTQFHLLEFGTRRRFSFDVQHAVLTHLHHHFPYLQGTSNYHFAKTLAISPVGTQAHEWFQAHQQLSPHLADSQKMALQVWLNEYPNQLGVALTDCITMDAFLKDFTLAFANQYTGLRHDSGNAIEWGEKAIAHYEKLGIDPLTKTLVFSDSLNLNKALAIYRHFYQRINMSFGIGTYLSCDLPDTKSLNIVIKLIECNGKPVAKLSDSPGKTVANNLEFINQLRHTFNLSTE